MEAVSFDSTRSLRNLYFVRTAFQVVWAAGVIITATRQPQLAAVLFLLYPLWDVACTVYDLNTFSNRDRRALRRSSMQCSELRLPLVLA